MRFVAPAREAIDAAVFARPPLSHWSQFDALLHGTQWPDLGEINRVAHNVAKGKMPHFVAQTPALLGDGLHYETRIAERGVIATRERNWHDLLNALIWIRFPELKAALNARQTAEIARIGNKQRSRAQCALTHFDEAGIVVVLRDAALLAAWDAHDWHTLFWRERSAWSDGRVAAVVFGHALLEHALKPGQLLVGKALVALLPAGSEPHAAVAAAAQAIARGELLCDPQEMRPLPLSGIPGWHADNVNEKFYSEAPCFCALRAGRVYPAPLVMPA